MKTLLISLAFAIILLGCASNKTNENDSQSDKPVAELNLAPGQISSKLKILTIDSSNTITAEVLEVLKYGSSTDPIPAGTELKLTIPETFSKRIKRKVKVGNTIQSIIASEGGGMMMSTNNRTANWKLISIK